MSMILNACPVAMYLNPNADVIIGFIVGFSIAYVLFLTLFSEKIRRMVTSKKKGKDDRCA